MNKYTFLEEYNLDEKELNDMGINWENLYKIIEDYKKVAEEYTGILQEIANRFRKQSKVHFVKSRIKDSHRLLKKIIRKTPNRRKKYGDDYNFTVENYKNEITDILGIRVIHIFKEDWEDIHKFVTSTWEVLEMMANIRKGDDTEKFEEKSIPVRSRESGYRSVHYLIKDKSVKNLTIELQVRTIFEEGYGEVDHQLRYSHDGDIPEILAQNLMLLNRISGGSDEMASLINSLNKSFKDIEYKYNKKLKNTNNKLTLLESKILEKNSISKEDKDLLLSEIEQIISAER